MEKDNIGGIAILESFLTNLRVSLLAKRTDLSQYDLDRLKVISTDIGSVIPKSIKFISLPNGHQIVFEDESEGQEKRTVDWDLQDLKKFAGNMSKWSKS
ncbi:MAG TPA: hypothetical protein VKC54_01980 [Patescibacteria group bacterium]|nr:hypothetical protein [Patescibacteria group bacterium]